MEILSSRDKTEAKNNFNKFKWYYKDNFEWEVIHHNHRSQRTVYLGKKNLNAQCILKSIKVNNEIYKTLLKEAYFLSCVKNNIYFTDIVDLFTSDNCEFMYIILRNEGVNLKDFISSKSNYNTRIANISRYIIFQVVCGLKILHERELSHNDIKPSNIIISGTTKVKICDLGSTDKTGTVKGSGTDGYLSPQALVGLTRSRADDMYAVGIVFLELLNWKIEIFKEKADKNEEKLKLILKKYYDTKVPEENSNENLDENRKYNIIINSIKERNYNNFEYRLKLESDEFKNIAEESDKELIKNLLEINPKERMTAQQVLDLPMFQELNFRFDKENSEIKFKGDDYNNYIYFPNNVFNEKIFKRNIEDIREKFIGKTLFETDKLGEK
jgi:serine/threonine protein kinase